MIGHRRLRLWALLPIALGVSPPASPANVVDSENVLVVVADDVGVDLLRVYGSHPSPAITPTIDRIASRGVLFRNAWGQPVCSPARAALMTGRAPFRTGIGRNVDAGTQGDSGLTLGEVTLPELVAPPMSVALVGKWHLAGVDQGLLHPNHCGLRAYSGTLNNIGPVSADYWNWPKVTNGQRKLEPTYATTDTVDEALRLIEILPEPWLLIVAFNAPHLPYHEPPPELYTHDVASDPGGRERGLVKAMLEALDTELGRLLADVPAHTTGILVADNGTDRRATTMPFDTRHAKGTLYQGGLHVPLIVWGPRVRRAGSECAALVQLSDVYATVAEIAGAGSAAEDSVSLLPYLEDPGQASLRAHVFAEWFKPNGPPPYLLHRRAVRNARFKLLDLGLGEELYDLETDPHEQADLLLDDLDSAAEEAYLELTAVIGTG